MSSKILGVKVKEIANDGYETNQHPVLNLAIVQRIHRHDC
jgi:hypothetical protein